MSAEHLHTKRQARDLLTRATAPILCLVIAAAAGSIFYQYRMARRAPSTPAQIPYIKWTKTFGDSFSTSPILGDDGTLYIASVRGNVYSLDPSSAVRWQYHLPEFVAGGLLQDQEKNIYLTTLSEVFSLTASGLKRWETACSPARMWQDDQGGTLNGNMLYTACGKNFCALNKDDGRQIWTRPALDSSYSESAPVMLKDGVLVFVSDRRAIAVDRDGKTLWKYPHTLAITEELDGNNSPPEYWVDTPIAVGSDETLYMGSWLNERFLALDAHGTPKWIFKVGQKFGASPVVASDGTVLAVTSEGLLHAFSSDGKLKWKFQLPKSMNGNLHAAPVLGSDGTIYLLADQVLIALSPQGRVIWDLPLQGTLGGSPILAPDGTLYVGTFEGVIYAVQTASHGLMQSAWPKYQHDSSNSGRSQGVGGQ